MVNTISCETSETKALSVPFDHISTVLFHIQRFQSEQRLNCILLPFKLLISADQLTHSMQVCDSCATAVRCILSAESVCRVVVVLQAFKVSG